MTQRRKFSLRILICKTTSRINTLIRVRILVLKTTPKIPLTAADTRSGAGICWAEVPMVRENQVQILIIKPRAKIIREAYRNAVNTIKNSLVSLVLKNGQCIKWHELAKSRHAGRSRIEPGRSPDAQQLIEKTGFRLSPE